MPTEYLWIIQGLLGTLGCVLAWSFREVKARAEDTEKDLLAYKTYVAQTYVTDNQLIKALESLNKNIEQMAITLARIEDRQYQREQSHNPPRTSV